VLRVIDGDTLLLDNGAEVRLIGALAPKADLAAGPQGSAPERAAIDTLNALIGGRSITLRDDGRSLDRYGRRLAHVHVETPEGFIWLQERLIGEGYARAYALPGRADCLGPLLVAERAARADRRGLWGRGIFRIRSARDVPELLWLAGQFAIVEGRVVKVARTQRTAYINFGDDWRGDFTASIATSAVDRAEQGAARLGALQGKDVRVRGWIERRNGPMIVLGSLAEIEVLDVSAQKEEGPR
jgi:endonuclease YncB( thermonuclease family)